MEKYLNKIRPKHYPVLTVVLTMITFGITLSYLGLLGNGMYIILRSDLFAQYVPFIEMFTQVLKGDVSYWYSWSVNLGSNTSLLYAYYTLSPFNLLYLIFDKVDVNTITAIVMIGKAGLSAFAFQWFERKVLKQNGIQTVLFAMCYAMCGFQIVYFFNIIWLDALYILPIILWLIVKYVEEGKFRMLIAAYAFSFIVNFYMAYMIGIFSAIVFLLCVVLQYEKGSAKKTIKKVIGYGGSVLLAAGMAAAVLLPAGICLFQNIPENSVYQKATVIPTIFDIIGNLYIGQMQTLWAVYPYIYCGIPVLILIPFYFLNTRIPKKEKIFAVSVLVFLTIMVMFPMLNQMMHAGDQPNMMNYRYSFIYSFILLAIACRQSIYIRKIPDKAWRICYGALIAYYIIITYLQIAIIGEKNAVNINTGSVINIIALSAWFLLGNAIRRRKMKKVLAATLMLTMIALELGINGYICIGHIEHEGIMERKYEAWYTQTKAVTEELKERDQGLYRVSMYRDINNNTAAWMNYNGLTSFSSSENQVLRNFLQKVGVHASSLQIADAGYTDFLAMILGVKYRILGTDLSWIGTKMEIPTTLQEREKYLEYGYMVAKDITQVKMESDNPFEHQNQLLQSMTGINRPYFIPAEAEIKTENAEVITGEEKTIIKRRSYIDKNAEVKYAVPSCNGYDAYAFFSSNEYRNDAMAPYVLSDNHATYNNYYLINSVISLPYIIKSGSEADKEIHEFTIGVNENRYSEYYYQNAYFYYADDEVLEQTYECLRKNQWKITEYQNDFLSATVTATKEKPILFMSIPNDTGWRVKVDDKEVKPIALLEDAFMGIELSEGTHEIEMQYVAPGSELGQIISILAWAMFGLIIIGMEIVIRKNNSTNGEKQKK